jgi:triosephosphate isomerase
VTTRRAPAPFTIGVSLKSYLGHAHTLEWAAEVARIASSHTATRIGPAELFVAPTFPALVPVRGVLAGSGVALAAQTMFWQDCGPR